MANENGADDSYLQLMELEELESLQEEIEESGVNAEADWNVLPDGLRERLAALGVNSMQELVTRIAYMHAELDEAEEYSAPTR